MWKKCAFVGLDGAAIRVQGHPTGHGQEPDKVPPGDLFGVGEVVELGLEGLVVLALDLKLGLELFDQEFEARDFGAEFQSVGRDLTGT